MGQIDNFHFTNGETEELTGGSFIGIPCKCPGISRTHFLGYFYRRAAAFFVVHKTDFQTAEDRTIIHEKKMEQKPGHSP